jgi:hypothetical protein
MAQSLSITLNTNFVEFQSQKIEITVSPFFSIGDKLKDTTYLQERENNLQDIYY